MPETDAHEGECSFLFQPLDDEGRPQDRDHCRHCGKPRTDLVVSVLRDIAENYVRAIAPLMAAELEDYAGRLEDFMARAGEAVSP